MSSQTYIPRTEGIGPAARRQLDAYMDVSSKFFVTAAGAFLVMLVAQRFGQRIAGIVAALPLVTAPTLVWLSHDHGVAFAVGAAVGSVGACAMLAVFAFAFSLASRHGSTVALLAGLSAAALMATPVLAVGASLIVSLVFACTCIAVVQAALPRRGRAVPTCPASVLRMTFAAMTVGATTAALAALGPMLGQVATGLLSSLPLIGATAAVLEHASGGHPASTQFLRGYVTGLFGKAAFGALFACLAPQTGVALALAFSCVVAALLSLLAEAGTVTPRRQLVEV